MTRTGARGSLSPLPIPAARLERYRLSLRQRSRAQLPGAHLVRRRGQSLDFRELRPYLLGDDIRHVDWRASARHHRRGEYLLRTFEHEAQARIVISIDARQSMRLPESAPKLQVALWLAEAIAYVAVRSGDSVAFHMLFGPDGGSVADVGRFVSRARIRHALRRFATVDAGDNVAPRLSFASLERALPPGSVWLIVTDLYFESDDDVDRLAARIHNAQQGARWAIVVDLDSWPCEEAILGRGLRRIDGPGLGTREPRLDVTDAALEQVKERIALRKKHFHERARAGGYDRPCWIWPREGNPSLDAIFQRHFFDDTTIKRLLMKDGSS
jgi:Protein of unknown function DUF58